MRGRDIEDTELEGNDAGKKRLGGQGRTRERYLSLVADASRDAALKV